MTTFEKYKRVKGLMADPSCSPQFHLENRGILINQKQGCFVLGSCKVLDPSPGMELLVQYGYVQYMPCCASGMIILGSVSYFSVGFGSGSMNFSNILNINLTFVFPSCKCVWLYIMIRDIAF
jgi:hypothetical protein